MVKDRLSKPEQAHAAHCTSLTAAATARARKGRGHKAFPIPYETRGRSSVSVLERLLGLCRTRADERSRPAGIAPWRRRGFYRVPILSCADATKVLQVVAVSGVEDSLDETSWNWKQVWS